MVLLLRDPLSQGGALLGVRECEDRGAFRTNERNERYIRTDEEEAPFSDGSRRRRPDDDDGAVSVPDEG